MLVGGVGGVSASCVPGASMIPFAYLDIAQDSFHRRRYILLYSCFQVLLLNLLIRLSESLSHLIS